MCTVFFYFCNVNRVTCPTIRIINMRMAFVSGVLLISLGGCDVPSEIQYQLFSTQRASAIQNMAVLRAIHEGDRSTAIEYLDRCIDSAVLESWIRLQGMAEDKREEEIRFLKNIRSFRQQYPRAVSSFNDDTISEEINRIISEVEKVFDRVNDLE